MQLTHTTELWIQHEDFSVFGTIVEVYHLIDTLCWPNSGSTPVIWARTDTGWTMVFDGSTKDWPTTALFRLVIEEIQHREDAARDAYFEATGADEGLQPDDSPTSADEYYAEGGAFDQDPNPSAEELEARDEHLAEDTEPSFEDVVDDNSFNPSHPEGDEPSPEEVAVWHAHIDNGGLFGKRAYPAKRSYPAPF